MAEPLPDRDPVVGSPGPARLSRGVVLLVGLAGLGLILACLSAATSKVFDPDVHWLAAAGRWLLASGHVPAQNHFSFTAPDHVWLMHE